MQCCAEEICEYGGLWVRQTHAVHFSDLYYVNATIPAISLFSFIQCTFSIPSTLLFVQCFSAWLFIFFDKMHINPALLAPTLH